MAGASFNCARVCKGQFRHQGKVIMFGSCCTEVWRWRSCRGQVASNSDPQRAVAQTCYGSDQGKDRTRRSSERHLTLEANPKPPEGFPSGKGNAIERKTDEAVGEGMVGGVEQNTGALGQTTKQPHLEFASGPRVAVVSPLPSTKGNQVESSAWRNRSLFFRGEFLRRAQPDTRRSLHPRFSTVRQFRSASL
ncbi:hypothetical protein PoB_003691900 [Plakobranchus ocellatus]|uniref:Uncharacterized protein n=1 Tax=Plakobranchus ocellatus TaxID=259542 RepID=A0AAV4ARH9_9GAST|nr:hypothetical protein PoB_003691900 [Plakobranchus ocellatus]